jgi:nucleoside-diphosphate-sugar epimerase
VVCTSSCLTLFFGNEDKQTVSEEDWGKVEKCDPYPKSKIMAEREFWEMYRRQDLTKQHTEMVTVLPALVMGPGLMLHKNSSEGIVVEILKGGFPGYPKEKTFVDFVDVRDVADGHIKAMFTP